MSRFILGTGFFLDGSLSLCSLFAENSSFAGTVGLVMASTIFTSLVCNWAAIIVEAEQQPEVLSYGKGGPFDDHHYPAKQ